MHCSGQQQWEGGCKTDSTVAIGVQIGSAVTHSFLQLLYDNGSHRKHTVTEFSVRENRWMRTNGVTASTATAVWHYLFSAVVYVMLSSWLDCCPLESGLLQLQWVETKICYERRINYAVSHVLLVVGPLGKVRKQKPWVPNICLCFRFLVLCLPANCHTVIVYRDTWIGY